MKRNADDRLRRLVRDVRQGVPDAAIELAHELVRTGAVPQHLWYAEGHEHGHKSALQGHRLVLGAGWPDACLVAVDRTFLVVEVGDEYAEPAQAGAQRKVYRHFYGDEASLVPERWRAVNVAYTSCGALGHGAWRKSASGREWPWRGTAAYIADHDAHSVARVGRLGVSFVGRDPPNARAASAAVAQRLAPVLDAAVADWVTANQQAFVTADRSLEASALARSIGRYERAQKALDEAREKLVQDVTARLDVLGL